MKYTVFVRTYCTLQYWQFCITWSNSPSDVCTSRLLRTLSSLLVEDLHCSRYDDISLIAILLPADFLSLTCIILLIVQTTECPCDDDLHIGQFQNLFCNDISSAYRKPPELTRMLWQELLDNISYGNNVFTSTVLGTHPLSTVLYLYSYRYL